MSRAPGEAFRLEMGISHADFFRVFPRLVAPQPVERDGLAVIVRPEPGKELQVTLSEEKVRRIALLEIVYLELELRFEGFSASDREAFMGRFERAFQKGGG